MAGLETGSHPAFNFLSFWFSFKPKLHRFLSLIDQVPMGGKLLFRDFRTRLGKAMAAEAAKAKAQNKQSPNGKKTSPDRASPKQNEAKDPVATKSADNFNSEASNKMISSAQKSPQSKEVVPVVRKSPQSIPIVTIAPSTEEKENVQPDSSSSLIRVEMAESTTRDSPQSGSPVQCESPMTGSPCNNVSPRSESLCEGNNDSPLKSAVPTEGERKSPNREDFSVTSLEQDSKCSSGQIDSNVRSTPQDTTILTAPQDTLMLNNVHEMHERTECSGYMSGERSDSPILDVTTIDEEESNMSAPVTVQA